MPCKPPVGDCKDTRGYHNATNLQSSADENDEQIVDELSFEELDGFEEEKVIEEERLLVADAGHDASVGVVAGLGSVLVRISPQQLQHQFGRDFAGKWGRTYTHRIKDIAVPYAIDTEFTIY